MLVIRDFKCNECGKVTEKICGSKRLKALCKCGCVAYRFFSISNTKPHGTWIPSVLEVVDKNGGQHCQEFLKHPNRTNYENWKKKTGLRHLEPGEKLPQRESREDKFKRIKPELLKKAREREVITI